MADNIAPQQIVFIDSNVPDLQELLQGLAPGADAFVIDPSRDGLQQIAGLLAENDLSDLTSISIVGHGEAGQLDLGSTVLDDSGLSSHAAALAQIGAALAPGGSLQLFGCDVASGATGQHFIADLSQFAGGADVQAATHDIGLTAGGENCTLDASTGKSPAPVDVPFTAATQANFQGLLATTNDSQLIFIASGNNANGDASIQYANSSETTASNYVSFGPSQTNTSLTDPVQIVADTAAGLYFVIDPQFTGSGTTPGTVREGSLTSPAQATTVAYAVPNTNLFSEAFAIAIDTTNDYVYVSENQFNAALSDFTAASGIVRFSYNPTTGGVGAASAVYEPGVGTVNTYVSLSLDTANQKLYFANDSEGQFGSSPATNDIEVLNLSTNSVTVLATLPSGVNYFPSNTASNQYTGGGILAVAADTTKNLVFFATGTGPGIDSGNTAYEALNRIYVIDGSTAGQTPVELNSDPVIYGNHMYAVSLSFDSADQQLWVDYASEDATTGAGHLGAVVRYDVTGTTPGTVSLTNPTVVSLKLAESPSSLTNDAFPEGSFLNVLPVLTLGSGTTTE